MPSEPTRQLHHHINHLAIPEPERVTLRSGLSGNCFAERSSYSTGANSDNGSTLVGLITLTTTTTIVLSAHAGETSINAKADAPLSSNNQHKTTGIVALLVG